MPELLAPAGSMDGIRAAVQSGADAVYFGFGTFNARRGAKNFSREEMEEAIAYCRLRGVKTNITFNIVATDRELPKAMEDVRFLQEVGADALIVQDLGVAREIRRHAPMLALHASTQMTIHTLDGALQAKALGFSRVVLSRECTLQEIEKITWEAGIETEVFVHGALCMCYSGQCYLSAVIGQRSGNRGLCAQPCRLPYTYQDGKKGYPLSLKDLCASKWIPTLTQMGVSCFKIEGRMKRPEYSAVVTQVYANLLREQRVPTKTEMETLRKIFSRDGFTDGYLTGHVDQTMFGTKTEVPLAAVKDLYAEAAQRMQKELPRVPVVFACAINSKGMELTVADADGNVAQAEDCAPIENAKNRPTTREMIEKNLSKTGGTPFYAEKIEVSTQEGFMIPAARLNNLRRVALERLCQLRTARPQRPWIEKEISQNRHKNAAFAGYTLEIRKIEQLSKFTGTPHRIYVPLEELALQETLPSGSFAVQMPRVYSDAQQPEIEKMLKQVQKLGVDTACAMNLGQIRLLQRLGFVVHGGFGLNVCNHSALQALQEIGVQQQVLSFELRTAQIRDMYPDMATEMLVYGHLPLMIFENCAIRRRTGKCTCQTEQTTLTDRTGNCFPVLPAFGCRNVLLNSKPLYLADQKDWKKTGILYGRICMTIESPEQVQEIWKMYQMGNEPATFPFTRGLYQRGVE